MHRLLPILLALSLAALAGGQADAHWPDKHHPLPLRAWFCGNVNAVCSQATQPNIDNIGTFDSLEWAAGENDKPVTIQIDVPDSFNGAGHFTGYFAKSAQTSDDDTMQLQWASAGMGDAVNPGLTDEGSQQLDHVLTISRLEWDLDGAVPAPDDILHFLLQRSAGANENVHFIGGYLEYSQ